jgi:hypothetical protein
MIQQFIKKLKYKGELGYYFAKMLTSLNRYKNGNYLNDKDYISKRFLNSHDYPMNWDNPQSLNEKLQVLKWQYNKDLHATVSDKYAARQFIMERFGEEYLIPLVFETKNPIEITDKVIPDFPVIVKANHDAGNNFIIRDKKTVDWKKLQTDCRWWLSWNYYYTDREQQYKNIDRRIIVEKLLTTKDGKIPNDYKLNYINGNLEFVYVSLDRECGNFRNIYDIDWNPLEFKWAKKYKLKKTKRGHEISPPPTWELMKSMGAEIAKLFPCVRVDFYDVDGKLYFGEITLCHGGGFDCFEPKNMDFHFGSKLILH